jgi:hypothetical protein
MHAQLQGKVVVEFNGNDAGGSCGQGVCNGAAARADLDYGAAREIAERGDDALDGIGVVEEVLSEFRLGGHALS